MCWPRALRIRPPWWPIQLHWSHGCESPNRTGLVGAAMPGQRNRPAGLYPAVMLRLVSVTKRYADGTVAVDDLSLEVDSGEICMLVGPSGSGKTTTMRMINRLI